MDDIILCGTSAFKYYRTPPQVLELYPPLVRPRGRTNSLSTQPIARDVLGETIEVLATSRSSRTSARSLRYRFWQGDIPPGHIRETDWGFRVVSPELALFQMAARCTRLHLTMAMMELCGWFSVFKPTLSADEGIFSAIEPLSGHAGYWRQSANANGRRADLWQRQPLIDIADLRLLARDLQGRRGSVNYSKAIEMVPGVVASPFEARASLLFSLPRKCGGEGLPCFESNAEVAMTKSARLVSSLSKCYVDLLFPGNAPGHSIAIECQGRSAHGADAVTVSDANRMLALETMGFDVMLLTYEQIADADRFRAVATTLVTKMGRSYRPKTPSLLEAERKLRSELFVDWSSLGK